MIELFVALSNSHISIYEALIKADKVGPGTKIIITSNSLQYESNLWDKTILIDNSFNNQSDSLKNSFKNIYLKIRNYKQVLKQLEPYKNENKIRLYFTYIEDILTNHLLLSYSPNVEGIVVEDGTLNYYLHTIRDINILKLVSKWFMSNFMGIRFKFYKGHSSGIDYEHVKAQYVRAPDFAINPHKSQQLPIVQKEFLVTETMLLIGQEAYINMYGLKKYHEALDFLIERMKNMDSYSRVSTIYYKPHRHGQRINYLDLKKKFSIKKLQILEESTPLEELYFNNLRSKYIFSFDSSALINIFLESEEDLRKHISINVLMAYNKRLEPIFKNFNFNIIHF